MKPGQRGLQVRIRALGNDLSEQRITRNGQLAEVRHEGSQPGPDDGEERLC
jgi:hypothetical protein